MGIDIGGTRIKVACVSEFGALVEWRSVETPQDDTWTRIVRETVAAVQTKMGATTSRIGIAAPGLAARDGRSIAFMPGRLPGLEGLDWTSFFNAPSPIQVMNDAHAALIGENAFGAAAGLQDALMLTLGTGVGGAILSNGKVMTGHLGRAGHLGHICLDPNGAPDIVNTPGSLEDAIGDCTVLKRSNGKYATTEALVTDHLNGVEAASAIWLASVRALACGIAGLINVLDPEAVVIGGGIANAESVLFGPLDEFLEAVEWRPAGFRVKIIQAKLGEKAGALGAAHRAGVKVNDSIKAFFDY